MSNQPTDEPIDDLPVPDEDAESVTGGIIFNASEDDDPADGPKPEIWT